MLETSLQERPGPREAVATVLLFLCLFGGPLALWALRGTSTESVLREQRTPAPPPELPRDLESLRGWPVAGADWFRDRFPGRGELLTLRGRILYQVFGVSPIPAMRVGKEDWLFYTDRQTFEFYRGVDLFEPDELDEWVRRMHAWRDWLKARDVEFLLITPPDKVSVYSEYLPEGTEPVSPVTRLDQFLSAVAERTPIEYLNPTEALLDAKDWGLLYFPHGVHWNDRGAYVAYREALQQLQSRFPALVPLPLERFDVVDQHLEDPDWRGDSWAGRMHLEGLLTQEAVVMRLRGEPPYQVLAGWPNAAGTMDGLAVQQDASLPRIVLVRDSFGDWFWQFLALHASFLITEGFVRHPFELVEQHRPDLLIHMRHECGLMEVPPDIRVSEEDVALARAWLGADRERLALELQPEGRAALAVGPAPRGAVLRVERKPDPAAGTLVRVFEGDQLLHEQRTNLWDGRRWAFLELPPWTSEVRVEVQLEGLLGAQLGLP